MTIGTVFTVFTVGTILAVFAVLEFADFDVAAENVVAVVGLVFFDTAGSAILTVLAVSAILALFAVAEFADFELAAVDIETIDVFVGFDAATASGQRALMPSSGETSNFAFREEEPPPTVIILTAFSPTTRIFPGFAAIGRTPPSFLRRTMDSAPIFRAAA